MVCARAVAHPCSPKPASGRSERTHSQVGARLHDRAAVPAEELAVPPPEIGGAADVARLQLGLARRGHRIILKRDPTPTSDSRSRPLSKPSNESTRQRPSWAGPT